MDEDKKLAASEGECEECSGQLCSNCHKCCKCGKCSCNFCHPKEKDNEPFIEEPINYS
ncbi:hypothetical protein GW932_03275 [archaeon]|nr:hypothetical protein [archaeon]